MNTSDEEEYLFGHPIALEMTPYLKLFVSVLIKGSVGIPPV
jgi:hypothetical protein